MGIGRLISITASLLGAVTSMSVVDGLGVRALSPVGVLVGLLVWVVVWQLAKRAALDWLDV